MVNPCLSKFSKYCSLKAPFHFSLEEIIMRVLHGKVDHPLLFIIKEVINYLIRNWSIWDAEGK